MIPGSFVSGLGNPRVFWPGIRDPRDFTPGSGRREAGNIKASSRAFPRTSDFALVRTTRIFFLAVFILLWS